MTVRSAGVLLFRVDHDTLRVFLAHMGGPFWQHKDAGAWTIPKGEVAPDEDPEAAAAREFEEEIGTPCPDGLASLGSFRQSSAKIVDVFVAEADSAVEFVRSNEFEMEWPPGSGIVGRFPEVDRAEWCDVAVARERLVKGQVQVLDALVQRLTE